MKLDLDHPSKTEQYLMAIAAEVRALAWHVWGKQAPVRLQDLKLRFGPQAPGPRMTLEEATAASKAKWGFSAMRAAARAGGRNEEELKQLEVQSLIRRDKQQFKLKTLDTQTED